MHRFDIINHLIQTYDYKSYLEIGVAEGECFRQVKCDYRVGIDPEPYHEGKARACETGAISELEKATSDQYFAEIRCQKKFDIIFIDGLHLEKQAMSDIRKSLRRLRHNGTIVVHDCNPPLANLAAKEPRVFVRHADRPEYSLWNGTTWKAFVRTRLYRRDLTTRCVDADWGCGIIQRGPWIPWDGELMDEAEFRPWFNYDIFAERRAEYLNLITPREFKEIYK